MIDKDYSDTLVDLAYASAERKILQAVIDISENRNSGFKLFQNFSIRELLNECHEEVLQDHLGDDE